MVWKLPAESGCDPAHMLIVLDELPSRTPCHHPAVLRLLKAWHGAPMPADPSPLPSDEGLLLSVHRRPICHVQFHSCADQQLLTAVEGSKHLHVWSCSYASGVPQWSHVATADLPQPADGGRLVAAALDLGAGQLLLAHSREHRSDSKRCSMRHSVSCLPFSVSVDAPPRGQHRRVGTLGAGEAQLKVSYGMEAGLLLTYTCAGTESQLQLLLSSNQQPTPPSSAKGSLPCSTVYAVVTGADSTSMHPPVWCIHLVPSAAPLTQRCPPIPAAVALMAAGVCPASDELVLLAIDQKGDTILQHLAVCDHIHDVEFLVHPVPLDVGGGGFPLLTPPLHWLPPCTVLSDDLGPNKVQARLAVQAHCVVVIPAAGDGRLLCVDRASGAVMSRRQLEASNSSGVQTDTNQTNTAPVMWDIQPFASVLPFPASGRVAPLQCLPAPPLDGSERYKGQQQHSPRQDAHVLPEQVETLPPFVHLVCTAEQAISGALQQRGLDYVARDVAHSQAAHPDVPALYDAVDDAYVLPLDMGSGIVLSSAAGASALLLLPAVAYSTQVAVTVAKRSRENDEQQSSAAGILKAAAHGHLAAVSSLRFVLRGLASPSSAGCARSDRVAAVQAAGSALTAHAMAAVALICMLPGALQHVQLPALLPLDACETASGMAGIAVMAAGDDKSPAWRMYSQCWGVRVEPGGGTLPPAAASVTSLQLLLARWGESRLYAATCPPHGVASEGPQDPNRPLWEAAQHLLLTAVCHPAVLLSVAARGGPDGALTSVACLLQGWLCHATPTQVTDEHNKGTTLGDAELPVHRKTSTVTAAFESLQDVFSADLTSRNRGRDQAEGPLALPFGEWGLPHVHSEACSKSMLKQMFHVERSIAGRAHAVFASACEALIERSPSARAALTDLARVLNAHKQVARDIVVDKAAAAFAAAFPDASGSSAVLLQSPLAEAGGLGGRSSSGASSVTLLPMFAAERPRGNSNSFAGTADSTKLAALMDQHTRGVSISSEGGGSVGVLTRAVLPVPAHILQLLLPSEPLALTRLLSHSRMLAPFTEAAARSAQQSAAWATLLSALQEQLGVAACLELPLTAPAADMVQLLHPLLLCNAVHGGEAWSVQAALVRGLFHLQPQQLLRLAILLRRVRDAAAPLQDALSSDSGAWQPANSLEGTEGGEGGQRKPKHVQVFPAGGASSGSMDVFQVLLGMLPPSHLVSVPVEHTHTAVDNFRGVSQTQLWQIRVRARLLRAAGLVDKAATVLADNGLYSDALQMLHDSGGAAGDEPRAISVTAVGDALALAFGWQRPALQKSLPAATSVSRARAGTGAKGGAAISAGEQDMGPRGEGRGAVTEAPPPSQAPAPRTPSKFARMMEDARKAQESKPRDAAGAGLGAGGRRHSRTRSWARSPSPGGGSDDRSTRSRGTSASFSAEQEVWGRGTAPLDSILFDLLGEDSPSAPPAKDKGVEGGLSDEAPPTSISASVQALGQMVAQGTAPVAGDLAQCHSALLGWCLEHSALEMLRQVLLCTPARFSAASLHTILVSKGAPFSGLCGAHAGMTSRGSSWSDHQWRQELLGTASAVQGPSAGTTTARGYPTKQAMLDTLVGVGRFLGAVQREALHQRTQALLSNGTGRDESKVLLRGFA